MYLTLDQVTLIENKRKLQANDAIVYERELYGQRIFTTDGSASKHATDAKPYGRIYFDARDQPCIVPDVWYEDDAVCAREAIRE